MSFFGLTMLGPQDPWKVRYIYVAPAPPSVIVNPSMSLCIIPSSSASSPSGAEVPRRVVRCQRRFPVGFSARCGGRRPHFAVAGLIRAPHPCAVFIVSSHIRLIAHRSEHEAVAWLSFFQSCTGEGRFKVRPGHRYGSVASERVFGSPAVLPS